MAIDIEIRDRIADSITAKIKAIGQAAASTNEIIKRLKQSLNFNAAGLNSVTIAVQGTTRATNVASASVNRLAASYDILKTKILSARGSLSVFESGITRTAQRFRTFASGLLLLGATAGIASTIDAYQNLQNHSKLIKFLMNSLIGNLKSYSITYTNQQYFRWLLICV